MTEITAEEALSKVSKESLDELRELIHPVPTINTCQKMNNDIIMNALCRAVSENVIQPELLDEKIIKLLNSPTNTVSAKKLGEILSTIREEQKTICCVITLENNDLTEVIDEWVFTGPKISFNHIFGVVIDYFKITPTMIRTKMTEKFKTTIVNNIAQLVAKYNNLETEKEKNSLTISITTISRLVNMAGAILSAEFKPVV